MKGLRKILRVWWRAKKNE